MCNAPRIVELVSVWVPYVVVSVLALSRGWMSLSESGCVWVTLSAVRVVIVSRIRVTWVIAVLQLIITLHDSTQFQKIRTLHVFPNSAFLFSVVTPYNGNQFGTALKLQFTTTHQLLEYKAKLTEGTTTRQHSKSNIRTPISQCQL